MTTYALALDAGGTATRAWIVTRDGTVVGGAVGGPGNHILSGLDVVRASFADVTRAACADAGCTAAEVVTVVAGCAGIEATGETRAPIERLLADLVPAAAHRRALGDMVIAFYGALPGGVGVIISAGTGAVAYGENAAGKSVQVDGWGPLFGDEGSGYAIGHAALHAAARARDGRDGPTLLTERIPAALGASDLRAAAYRLYAMPDARKTVASVARVVADAATEGDATAGALMEDAASALAQSTATAVHSLELAGDAAQVATLGSLFLAGAVLREPFCDALCIAGCDARVVEPMLPPVGGAAKLAWAAAGTAWGDTEIERARATQPRTLAGESDDAT